MGHISPSVVQKAVQMGRIQGDLPFAGQTKCECWTTAKLKQAIRRATDSSTSKKLELVHIDICGPLSVTAIKGYRYLLTFTNDFARMSLVYPLVDRGQTPVAFAIWKTIGENQSTEKLQRIRSDNAKEYVTQYIREEAGPGVAQELTVPYNPNKNSVAERLNKTLFSRVRVMLADAELPLEFWTIAAETATYIHNKMPQGQRKRIPEEDWTGKPVKLSYFQAFCCVTYVHIPKKKRTKFETTAWKDIFVG